MDINADFPMAFNNENSKVIRSNKRCATPRHHNCADAQRNYNSNAYEDIVIPHPYIRGIFQCLEKLNNQ